ncbi:MAG: 6-phosphogluconolactonase [Candidatus Levybacteria bacterium]|nr:6-phosphogluconolactonase [Candidatus Levybacteria bacterium]
MKKVTIITVENQQEGLAAAKYLLYKKVDDQTLLLLSGGSTPKDLYETIAQEKKLTAKAVGMVDERKDRSNYKMIMSTGLLDYLKNLKIKFYPMISASYYDRDIHKLIGSSKNKAAVMGIGADGHTAGLPAGTQISNLKSQNYVIDINNFPGEFRKRVTLTFRALLKMDLLIVLAFGENKKEALEKMFDPSADSGQEAIEEIPARFYLRPDIAPKTLLITDQKI